MNETMRYIKVTLFVILATLLAACQPVVSERIEDAMADSEAPAAAESQESMPVMAADGSNAVATVATRSLRVRSAPDGEAEVIYGLSEGDEVGVLEISDNGGWVRLAIADAPGGSGWVAANLVSINGTLPSSTDSEESMSDDAMAAEETETVAADSSIQAPESGFATVFTDGTRLRVRETPAVDSEIAGYVYNGETYPVLATSDDGLWIQIPGAELDVSDNVNGGWVTVEFMLIGE